MPIGTTPQNRAASSPHPRPDHDVVLRHPTSRSRTTTRFAGARTSERTRAAFWRGVQSAKAGGAGGEKVTAWAPEGNMSSNTTQRCPGR